MIRDQERKQRLHGIEAQKVCVDPFLVHRDPFGMCFCQLNVFGGNHERMCVCLCEEEEEEGGRVLAALALALSLSDAMIHSGCAILTSLRR